MRRTKDRNLTLSDLQVLGSEERFSALRSYGFILPQKENEIIVIKINETFSFAIQKDGRPKWQKKTESGAVIEF